MVIELVPSAISIAVLMAVGGTFYRVGLVKRQVDVNTGMIGKCEERLEAQSEQLSDQGGRLSRIEGWINGQPGR